MRLIDVLTPERVVLSPAISSKKRSLELASEIAAKSINGLDAGDIFENLVARERLGSTAIGHGIAIPHCRVADLDQTIAVMLRLETAVDFDAADGEPVDIVISLIVPEFSTEEHLQLLSAIAEKCSDEQYRQQIRTADTVQNLFKVATQYDD